MEESKLISLAQQGDKQALELLYRSTVDSLYKFVRYKVDQKEICEDICQESYLRAFKNIGKFQGKSSFKTYVYTIAHNQIIDYYKTKQMTVELDQDRKIEANEPQENLNAVKQVESILQQLPEKERTVLELRFLSGFSVEETAESLSLSKPNIKVITHRALKAAQQILLSTK